MLEQRFEEA